MAKFLPWSVETVQGGPKIYAGGGSDHAICQLFSRDGVAFLDANENAALIVKAVNNHETMLKTLQVARLMIAGEIIEHAVIDTQTRQSLGDAIDAAINAAVGGSR